MRPTLPSFPRLLAVLVVTIVLTGLPRTTSASSLIVLGGFPTLRQQHNLTCESSVVSMATRGLISETQLMRTMPRSANPNLGFRGNPNGFQGTSLVDYGVYAGPLHRALLQFGYRSDLLLYAHDADLRTYIQKGWPVAVWVTYQLKKAAPRLAQNLGVQFFLVPHEHAVLVVGYDATTVIANDPWTGAAVRYFWRDFNRAWGYFGNMGLAVEPCPTADPVSTVRLGNLSDRGITWNWKPARNAVQYQVTVTRSGSENKLVYQGVQTARHLTVSNPIPGIRYQISVVAVDGCGGVTSPSSLVAQLPAVLATATPVPERTVLVTPTATPTLTTSPTTTPTAVATAPPSATPVPTRAPAH